MRRALEGKPATPHPHSTLVALALHDDDKKFVESWCLRLARAAPDRGTRAVSALCISYLARRFGTVSAEAVELVRTLAADPVVGAHPAVQNAIRIIEQPARPGPRPRPGSRNP